VCSQHQYLRLETLHFTVIWPRQQYDCSSLTADWSICSYLIETAATVTVVMTDDISPVRHVCERLGIIVNDIDVDEEKVDCFKALLHGTYSTV